VQFEGRVSELKIAQTDLTTRSCARENIHPGCYTLCVGRAMAVDRKWVERNLGFDPIEEPAPPRTFAFAPAAAAKASPEDYQREIIDFDSESPAGLQFLAFSTATGLSRFKDIPWPARLAPKTGPKPRGGRNSPLPKADVLVVTWTVDEGHALSRVLTPGKDSQNDYLPYTHNFAKLKKDFRRGCPALKSGRLGAYWPTSIGGKSVVVFKSESHMSQDGPRLPNIEVWRQIIREVQPKLVITTGTGGGIGKQFEVGDVIVSPMVRFDCIKNFKGKPFAHADYKSIAAKKTRFKLAKKLFKENSNQLPKDNNRQPKIVCVSPGALNSSIVTTDFFGFDTSNNYFKLQGLGDLSEMGDAILGMVAKEMGEAAPRWLSVRNVSDPQIKAAGLSLRQQAKMASDIYKGFGRWSSICSAIICWASIVAE
jgi:Phosphorylase superfamily